MLEAKSGIGPTMSNAFFSYAQACYAAGPAGRQLAAMVQSSVGTAAVRSFRGEDNIAGVRFPRLAAMRVVPPDAAAAAAAAGGQAASTEAEQTFSLLGLGGGGLQVQNCRNAFGDALDALIQIANVQASSESRHNPL